MLLMIIKNQTSADEKTPRDPHRRQFVGQVGGAAAALAASVFAGSSAASAESPGSAEVTAGPTNQRVMQAFNLRVAMANQDAGVPAATNVNNGDDALYPDKGGTFTKGLPHDSFGRVDLTAYGTLKTALASAQISDFEKVVMGGTKKLNGPQGGMAFDLEGLDSAQFGQPQVPPAPPIGGDQTGTELLEHYWASLLRDVAFTDYRRSRRAQWTPPDAASSADRVGH